MNRAFDLVGGVDARDLLLGTPDLAQRTIDPLELGMRELRVSSGVPLHRPNACLYAVDLPPPIAERSGSGS
jgi:hypothetical protein